MREKTVKKRGRKQKALRCLLWMGILLLFNTVFHGLPLFRFQARNTMEIEFELEKSHVIWEETANQGWWNGKTHCLSADSDTAIFYNMHLVPFYGWENGVLGLLNKNTSEVIDALWDSHYDADNHRTMWIAGYVASDQVAYVEYTFIWEHEIVETYLVPQEAYVWDGNDRYYIYDTGTSLYSEDGLYGNEYGRLSNVIVIVRDEKERIIYQKSLYPKW